MCCANASVAPYSQALQVAVQVAQAAGQQLRAEFHCPDGPRGGGGHAEVDDAVEALIRQHLTAAFPDYGMVGEELGQHNAIAPDPDQHVWVVDPHDGTAAFLQGHRGSAVAIALLRQGIPVLGVVYAFSAPDDRGDLFAWAEGCGPLTRNGQPIQRSWADRLTVDHTVLVSQAGDRNSLANAELVAPARFRTMPSIAYRLALVAAGAGEVAVSLNGPVSWDYAAGDALLRGVGGVLVDQSGQPVTYEVSGYGYCQGHCFGGSPAIAPQLATKNWSSVYQRPALEPGPYPLLKPLPGFGISNPDLLSRAQGCLVGQLAGDALGSLVEFQSKSEIRQAFPEGVRRLADGGTWNTIAGQPTDDSELALMLARALVQSEKFDLNAIATAYSYWYRSAPFDIGSTTRQALSAAAKAVQNQANGAIAAQQSANPTSQANGALMRVSPLGIFGHAIAPEMLATWARAEVSLSHPHGVCQDASAVFVIAIREALVTGQSAAAIYQSVLDWAETAALHPEVLDTLRAAATHLPEDYSRNMGWVRIALHNAFYQLLHAPNLAAGIVDTVMQGGDTDTNGAIAGALLGAIYGLSEIPAQWQDRVLTCRAIPGLAGVHHPRPVAFWPVDALVLAERLLAIGQGLS